MVGNGRTRRSPYDCGFEFKLYGVFLVWCIGIQSLKAMHILGVKV